MFSCGNIGLFKVTLTFPNTPSVHPRVGFDFLCVCWGLCEVLLLTYYGAFGGTWSSGSGLLGGGTSRVLSSSFRSSLWLSLGISSDKSMKILSTEFGERLDARTSFSARRVELFFLLYHQI